MGRDTSSIRGSPHRHSNNSLTRDRSYRLNANQRYERLLWRVTPVYTRTGDEALHSGVRRRRATCLSASRQAAGPMAYRPYATKATITPMAVAQTSGLVAVS
jgi:hypothetical protein